MINVDEMITLENNENYGILLESEYDYDTYYLAVKLDENEEPTDEFKVIKEIIKDGRTFIQEEKNPDIVAKLLEDFNLQNEE